MSVTKFITGSLIVPMITVAAWIGYERLHAPNPAADDVARQVAAIPDGPKSWQEVSRVPVVSQSLDLRGYAGWLHAPIRHVSENLKIMLISEAAASDPDRVTFEIMDAEDYQRMQAGSPPIVIASNPIGVTQEQEAPYGKQFWFGYVEAAPTPPPLPVSPAAAILSLLARRQDPPVRLTAKISMAMLAYCSATEARRLRIELKNEAKQ